jgi:hypothetical protein
VPPCGARSEGESPVTDGPPDDEVETISGQTTHPRKGGCRDPRCPDQIPGSARGARYDGRPLGSGVQPGLVSAVAKQRLRPVEISMPGFASSFGGFRWPDQVPYRTCLTSTSTGRSTQRWSITSRDHRDVRGGVEGRDRRPLPPPARRRVLPPVSVRQGNSCARRLPPLQLAC